MFLLVCVGETDKIYVSVGDNGGGRTWGLVYKGTEVEMKGGMCIV